MTKRYKLTIGEVVLPPVIENTRNRLAIPRPDTPLLYVVAPKDTFINTLGGDGAAPATLSLPRGCYHVIGSPGHQRVVGPRDVATLNQRETLLPYRLNRGSTTTHPALAEMQRAWPGHPVATLQRMQPALVMGRLPEAADAFEQGWLDTEDGGWWTIPGAWIIRELSGRGARIVTSEQLDYEFEGVTMGTPYPVPLDIDR